MHKPYTETCIAQFNKIIKVNMIYHIM